MEVTGQQAPGLSGLPKHEAQTGAANKAGSRSWDRRCTLAAIVVLAVYLLVLWVLPADVFWSPDEGAKLLQMQAMTLDNGLRWEIVYPGQRLDPGFDFYPSWIVYPQRSKDCTVNLNWPIWFGLFSLVPYHLLGIVGLYVLPLLCGFSTAILSGMLTWRFRPSVAPLAILLVGLASPVIFYSVLFWEHTVVAFLGLLALWQLLRLPDQQHPWTVLAISGACLLLASAVKSEMLVFSFCLVLSTAVVFFVYHRRQGLSWLQARIKQDGWQAVGTIVALAGLVWVLFMAPISREHQVAAACDEAQQPVPAATVKQPALSALSRTVETHFRWAVYRLKTLPQQVGVVEALAQSWFSAVDAPLRPQSGRLGFLGVCICMLGGLLFRWRGARWLLLVGAGLVIVATHQILLYPDRYRFIHALFLPAPLMALASLFVLVAFRRRRYDSSLLLLMSVSYLLLGTLMIIARGAYVAYTHPEWGARYLLPLYPLLIVCALLGIDEAIRQIRAARPNDSQRYPIWLLLIAVLMVGLGMAFSWRGVSEIFTSKRDLSAYQTAIIQADRPVVTNLTWLPSALAPYFATHEIYVVSEQQGLEQWLDFAGDRVQSFIYVIAPGPLPRLLTTWDGGSNRLAIVGNAYVNGFVFWEIELN
jgi:hypothetical protein